MALKSTIISSFAKIILGSSLFERIKATVIRQEEKFIAGSKKREAVLAELQVIGISAATYLINLGIELAVAWLKTQSEKK
jgi:hypothetical protein